MPIVEAHAAWWASAEKAMERALAPGGEPEGSDTPEWDGERCHRCGRPYALVWHSPDELWIKVTGRTDGGGLLCPDCFDALAMEKGIGLRWECVED